MRLNMKGITEMATTAAKMCRATYDSGVTWEKIALDACTRYLMEEQRAELYASANAALYDKLTALHDKLTALQSDPSDSAAARSFRLTQDQLRPGDPRRDLRMRLDPDVCRHTLTYLSGTARQCGLCFQINPLKPGTPLGKPLPEKESVWSTPCTVKPSTVIQGNWDIMDKSGYRVAYVASEELANFIVNSANSGALKPLSVSNTPKEATGYSPAVTIRAELPSNSLCHYDSPVLRFPNRRTGPLLTIYDPTPEARASSDQSLRRIADEPVPGRIVD